jgi:putative chitinase
MDWPMPAYKSIGGKNMQFDRDKFFEGIRDAEHLIDHLTQGQVDDLNALLGFIEADPAQTDVRNIAYQLATTYHETGHTFQPIEEFGKGRGRAYGVPDPATGQTYYGRGYVQLTWKRNYELFAQKLGPDLVNHPELAMEPDTAYKIMSLGMYQGLFTSRKLSDYINDTKKDYVNARRIINGTDRAQMIADYATSFEQVLTDSLVANP